MPHPGGPGREPPRAAGTSRPGVRSRLRYPLRPSGPLGWSPTMTRQQRLLRWLFAALASAALTAAIRASLRGERSGALWLAALVAALLLTAQWTGWIRTARATGIVLAGPAVSVSLALALRTWVPDDSALLSFPGVLRELAHSPVFYVPLAFGVSWSLLGLRVRPPGAPSRGDRWRSTPLLVWALLASRANDFYFSSGHMDYASRGFQIQILWVASWVLLISLFSTLATTLPTWLRERRSHRPAHLALVTVLPVLLVCIDWIFFCTVLSVAWLKQSP